MSEQRQQHYLLPEADALYFASLIEGEVDLTVPAENGVVLLSSTRAGERLSMHVAIDDTQATTISLADNQPLRVRNLNSFSQSVFGTPIPYLRYRPRQPGTGPDDWLVEAPGLRIDDWNDFVYLSGIVGSKVISKLSMQYGLSVRSLL